MTSSSSSYPFSQYGTQQQANSNVVSGLGMGSMRGSSTLAQLTRGNSSSPSMSFMGFNSTVGGGRLTPTAASSAANAVAAGFSAGGAFTGPAGLNFASPGGFSSGGQNAGGRQSTLGMNLLSTSSNLGRNPLFNRERSKIGDSVNTFDPSEFPSLGSRESATPNSTSLSARSNYVGMVKQPAMETSEFTMSSEDFPALPGPPPSSSTGPSFSAAAMNATSPNLSTSFNVNASSSSVENSLGSFQGMSGVGVGGNHVDSIPIQSKSMIGPHEISSSSPADSQLHKRGIQTSPDGLVTNIPPSMVTDQFGMIGLLTFIRAAETDPNLVSLALGADLTTLGLNLNSEVNLYPTFGGPWAETPCRPQDIDFHVPFEYLTNSTIRDKLAPVKLNRYKDDVLFFMFYTNVGDVLQLAAAAELYNRDWRYHKEDRVWITRAPGMPPSEKTSTYERGTYYFFDVTNWRKVPKEFHLDYDKLEDRPSLPTNLSGASGGQTGSVSLQGGPPSASSSPAPPGISGPPQGSQHSPIMSGSGPSSGGPL